MSDTPRTEEIIFCLSVLRLLPMSDERHKDTIGDAIDLIKRQKLELSALKQSQAQQQQAWDKIERRMRDRRLPGMLREQA